MTEATQTNVFDELKWRGTTLDQTEGLEEVLRQEKVTAYIGFDPSAASLLPRSVRHSAGSRSR